MRLGRDAKRRAAADVRLHLLGIVTLGRRLNRASTDLYPGRGTGREGQSSLRARSPPNYSRRRRYTLFDVLLLDGCILMFRLVLGVAACALLIGCGGSDSAESGSAATSSAATSSASAGGTDSDGASATEAPSMSGEQLLTAALEGEMGTVRKAVESGVDVNVTNDRGNTPLMFAAYNGHTAIARYLLEQGAEIGVRNGQGRTALLFAATGPFPETAELLLERDADPNVTDTEEGWSPLMFAAAEGNLAVVETLLEHGADPTLTDADGETARTFAENGDHAEVAAALREAEGS